MTLRVACMHGYARTSLGVGYTHRRCDLSRAGLAWIMMEQ